MLACCTVMAIATFFAYGLALEAHQAMVMALQNRIVQTIPVSSRTNYSTLYYEPQTNR